MTKRIAMWSGPRNLSTAMMYSFGNRADTRVVDEPFYGVYLRKTGLDHPMRKAVLASMQEGEDAVIESLLTANDKPIFYQKHMTHHLLPDMRRDWMEAVENVFLIRHPARVLASYGVKRETFTIEDLGYLQQWEIYQNLRESGASPIIIDSHDIRANPRKSLETLCEALAIPFDEAMLSWPEGGHKADGVWAKHWYNAVHNSTGFASAEGELPAISPEHGEIYEICNNIYQKLTDKALKFG